MAIQCQNCGKQNRPGANFCRQCGQFLQVEVEPKKQEPAPPVTRSSPMRWLVVVGGIFAVCLAISLITSVLFFRSNNKVNEPIVSVASFGTALPPTAALTENLAEEETNPGLPSLPPTAALETLPTITNEPVPLPSPTLAALIIPGTDIEVPRVTDEEEIKIGRDVAREIEATFGVYRDQQQESRVIEIGQTILPYTERPHLPYQFTLLDSLELNAFAAPGGFIFVTRGMLDFTAADGELAAVIAHEIAHIAQRHSAEEIESIALAEAALNALLTEEPELANIYENDDGKMVADLTTMLVADGWSRQNELEADEYGVIYMAEAGYDPQAAVSIMERMMAIFPEEEQESTLIERLARTHPPFAERIQRIKTIIQERDLGN